MCPFSEGVTVQAVGKLRLFNNRLSLVAFHIRELIKREQIELFEYEAKLAHLYYEKVRSNIKHLKFNSNMIGLDLGFQH